MSVCDNKLKSNLMEAMKLDNQTLEAEMQTVAPHVFSDTHQKKMEKLLRKHKTKQKVRGVLRYVAAACLVLLFISSIFIISSKDLQASKLSVDIIEWLEEFFSVEKGEGGKKKERDVLFEESQIGYLPEGFEKLEDFIGFSFSYYSFGNNSDRTICIAVAKDKSLLQVDNAEDIYEVSKNEAGYEYSATYNKELGTGAIVWRGDDKLYYQVTGTIAYEELVEVMNGITY